MNKEMFYSVKKLNGLMVAEPKEGMQADNITAVASMSADVMQLGYILTPALTDKLRFLEADVLRETHEQLVKVLQNIKGADVVYAPMYPNFPEQVMQADEAELFFNQILHYLSAGEFHPDYVKEHRDFFPENVEFRQLDVVTKEDFEKVYTRLLASNDSLSQEDKDIVQYFLDNDGEYTLNLPKDGIVFKETLCILAGNALAKENSITPFVATATDVLRVVTHLNEGDISLADKTKFKSLPRAKRKLIANALIAIHSKNPSGFADDINRHEGKFNKLFHNLHVGDYSKKLHDVAKSIRDNSVKHKTFTSQVEELLANKDWKGAVNLLQTRPSEYARRLDHLLRMSKENNTVITTFNTIVDNVSTKILLQLLGHLKSRMKKQDFTVVYPKGTTQKALKVERGYDALSLETVGALMTIITDSLKARFGDLDELGNVYIHPALKQAPLPQAQRSASTAIDTVARGTRMNIGDEDKNTLRFFIYWVGQDIDLSCTFHDENFNMTNQVSYTNRRSDTLKTYHSGDITSAPNGASEFIDVDLNACEKAGVRYIAMNVYVYSGPNFADHKQCYAGWMTREKPQSNEIYDPKTVVNKVDMKQEARTSVPVMFDVKERKAIWVDLVTTQTRYNRGGNNTHSNQASIEEIIQNIVHSYENKATLYDLFEQHGLARGTLVDTPEEADVIYAFGEDATVAPTDINVINSEYIVG